MCIEWFVFYNMFKDRFSVKPNKPEFRGVISLNKKFSSNLVNIDFDLFNLSKSYVKLSDDEKKFLIYRSFYLTNDIFKSYLNGSIFKVSKKNRKLNYIFDKINTFIIDNDLDDSDYSISQSMGNVRLSEFEKNVQNNFKKNGGLCYDL